MRFFQKTSKRLDSGENCKNFKFLKKSAKISSFRKKLQISQGFGEFFVASDLNLKNGYVESLKLKSNFILIGIMLRH